MNNGFKNKGITLIALVITIIVLLILAGISINLVLGKNGIITRARSANTKSILAEEKEKIELCYTNANIKVQSGEESELTDDLLHTELYNENINSEVSQIDDNSYIVYLSGNGNCYSIINGIVEKKNGIFDITYTVKESLPIDLSNTIRVSNIKEEVGNYKKYEIVGISASQDGPFSTENVEGQNGTLSIKDDIQNSSYTYTLKKFMDGDDIFYCKVLIDDSIEKTQKITMKQGTKIAYEGDFIGFKIPEEFAEYYSVVEDERFTNGKALQILGQGRTKTVFEFDAVFSKMELQTACVYSGSMEPKPPTSVVVELNLLILKT